MRPAAGTVAELLERRVAAAGAGPLVTFYDDRTGERTELSAVTFANWVAKTANLLVDGLGAGPGDTAALALPVHWQSLVVAAGCWAAGLTVVFDGPADVAIVAEDGRRPEAGEVLALSLRPMGAPLTRPDPAVTDFAADVRGYGDRFSGRGPAPTDRAVGDRTHLALVGGGGSGDRLLLAPADGSDPELDADLLMAAYVRPLVGGGSIVLCRHVDRARLGQRLADERARLG